LPDNIYEVVSQAARYWFLFLMALIAWRSYRWLRRDRRQQKKRLRLLPDAGFVGELVVLKGNEELQAGQALPVGFEGTLGSLRGNDICVPVKGVAKKHLWFEFDEEDGLRIEPFRRQQAEVDGTAPAGRHGHIQMTHGSQLTVGEAVLKLRLFAGYEYAGIRHAEYHEPEPQPTVAVTETATVQQQASPTVAGGVTFTAEQVAVLQQMQWAAAMQAVRAAQQAQPASQTNVLMTEKGEFIPPPKMGERSEILIGEGEILEEPDEPTRLEESPSEPPRASRRSRLSPLPPIAAEAEPGASRRADARGPAGVFALPEEPPMPPDVETVPDSGAIFYPPVMEEETSDSMEHAWTDDGFPSGETFAPPAHVRFELDTDEPVDETDPPPRDLYVDPDEAEKAKRLLWDKYLKGGGRR